MQYQITVSLNGQFQFATERNISTASDFEHMITVYANLKRKLPPSQGYKVELVAWNSVGTQMLVSGV